MKEIVVHKVTNPKTIKMLREASVNPTKSKAQSLVREIYMDTGFKMSGRHMIIGTGNSNDDFLYIIEDIDSMDALKAHFKQLPEELRDIILRSGEFEVIDYTDKDFRREEVENAVNDIIGMLAKYCTEKDISIEDGVSYVLTSYIKLIDGMREGIEGQELKNLLVTQMRLLMAAMDEVKSLLPTIKNI